MKKIILCLLALLSLTSISAQDIYEHIVINDKGEKVQLSDYKGQVMLIVNTATQCGFTPQYKELEALYEKYMKKGFVILDFPCNQFGEQAPGDIEEIHNFCTEKYSISFPQFDKIEVNGENEHPLYAFLKKQIGFGGFDLNDRLGKLLDEMLRKSDPEYDKNPDIKWNFTKFLVNRDGKVIKRYEPTTPIKEVEKDIREVLKLK